MQLFNYFKEIFSKMVLFPRPKILCFLSPYLPAMISKLNVLLKLGHASPKVFFWASTSLMGSAHVGPRRISMSAEQQQMLGHRSDAPMPTVHESWLLLPKPSSCQGKRTLRSRVQRAVRALGSGLMDALGWVLALVMSRTWHSWG